MGSACSTHGSNRNTCNISVHETQGKESHWRPQFRGKNYMKTKLKQSVRMRIGLILLALNFKIVSHLIVTTLSNRFRAVAIYLTFNQVVGSHIDENWTSQSGLASNILRSPLASCQVTLLRHVADSRDSEKYGYFCRLEDAVNRVISL